MRNSFLITRARLELIIRAFCDKSKNPLFFVLRSTMCLLYIKQPLYESAEQSERWVRSPAQIHQLLPGIPQGGGKHGYVSSAGRDADLPKTNCSPCADSASHAQQSLLARWLWQKSRCFRLFEIYVFLVLTHWNAV